MPKQRRRKGKITPNGVILEKHEYETVTFLTGLGYDIELIPKSNQFGVHTPDIKIAQLSWEMKSPKGKGKFLMQNTIQEAVKQSRNVIIDLRRVKRPQQKCLQEIKREFKYSKSLEKIKIITKELKILDFKK